MKVLDFNIKRGIFHFEMNPFNATKHAHPLVEILYAINGTFSLETDLERRDNVTLAVIDANVNHLVISEECQTELLMVESHSTELEVFLSEKGITFSNGVYITKETCRNADLIDAIKKRSYERNLKRTNDQRVQNCLKIIESEDVPYDQLITHLTSKVFLSPSRLSHLFKENTGVSLKKYLVWARLKKAIHFLLNDQTSFTAAAYQSGFYDQSHLSNAFKRFLGVPPSGAYNSRTLQS